MNQTYEGIRERVAERLRDDEGEKEPCHIDHEDRPNEAVCGAHIKKLCSGPPAAWDPQNPYGPCTCGNESCRPCVDAILVFSQLGGF